MIKVGRLYREKIVEFLQKEKDASQGLLFVGFKGLNVNQLTNLRSQLREKKARLVVAKNRLLKIAFKDLKPDIDNFLKSETALIFSFSDIISVLRTLYSFKKENQSLNVKVGFLKDKLVQEKELESLSKFACREVLLGLTVNCFALPIIGLVNSLNGVILKFLWAIEEIKKKKESNA